MKKKQKYQVEQYCENRWIVTKPSKHKALENEDKFRVIAVFNGYTAIYPSECLAIQVAEHANKGATLRDESLGRED